MKVKLSGKSGPQPPAPGSWLVGHSSPLIPYYIETRHKNGQIVFSEIFLRLFPTGFTLSTRAVDRIPSSYLNKAMREIFIVDEF